MRNHPEPQYQWPLIDKSLMDAVSSQTCRSLSDQTGSGVIGEFERAFSDFLGASHVLAMSSGTAALHAMVKVAELQPGDEVIVGGYGFFATASPFAYEGIRIRFVDVDRLGNICKDHARDSIGPRTRAIMCVHMWGNPCDMKAFRELCDEYGLWLFEDCSHAHFARSNGMQVGALSDLAAFSFNQKAITCGEGGALVCKTRGLFEKAVLFGHYNKRCFEEVSDEHPDAELRLTGYGLKYRPNTLAMAIGCNQLGRAAEIRKRRKENYQKLRQALSKSELVEPVESKNPSDESGLYIFPMAISPHVLEPSDVRAELCRRMHGVGAYLLDVPGSTRDMSKLKVFAPQPVSDLPGVKSFADRVLKLPLWGYAGDEAIVTAYCEVLEAFT